MILSNDVIKKRSNEKLLILLTFLKEETYSDAENLMKLFDYKDSAPLYRLLNKTVKMGLIQKYVIESRIFKIPLWGITNDGLAIVLSPDDKTFPSRFEPSKITGWTLEHHLDNQFVRLILEKKGSYNWINGDRSTFLNQYKVKHRPDGLITLPGEIVIAIETERRLKTKARYQSIMESHLRARTSRPAPLWIYVFYIVPDEQKKQALIKIFSDITHVISSNIKVTLDDRHRKVFRFYTIDELKNLELTNYA